MSTTASATYGATEGTTPTPPPGQSAPPAPAFKGAFGPACAAYFPAGSTWDLGRVADRPFNRALVGHPQVGGAMGLLDRHRVSVPVNVTAFLFTDDAFNAISVRDRGGYLTSELIGGEFMRHHLVRGLIDPDQLVGIHETLTGETSLQVTWNGTAFLVGDEEADVVCGNVRTRDAVIYVLDRALIP